MSDLMFGLLRYFVVGFSLLGLIVLYIYLCDKIAKVKPRLGRALSALSLAGFYAVLLAIVATLFVGPKVALYLLAPLYVVSLFGAWKNLRPDGSPKS